MGLMKKLCALTFSEATTKAAIIINFFIRLLFNLVIIIFLLSFNMEGYFLTMTLPLA